MHSIASTKHTTDLPYCTGLIEPSLALTSRLAQSDGHGTISREQHPVQPAQTLIPDTLTAQMTTESSTR